MKHKLIYAKEKKQFTGSIINGMAGVGKMIGTIGKTSINFTSRLFKKVKR